MLTQQGEIWPGRSKCAQFSLSGKGKSSNDVINPGHGLFVVLSIIPEYGDLLSLGYPTNLGHHPLAKISSTSIFKPIVVSGGRKAGSVRCSLLPPWWDFCFSFPLSSVCGVRIRRCLQADGPAGVLSALFLFCFAQAQ